MKPPPVYRLDEMDVGGQQTSLPRAKDIHGRPIVFEPQQGSEGPAWAKGFVRAHNRNVDAILDLSSRIDIALSRVTTVETITETTNVAFTDGIMLASTVTVPASGVATLLPAVALRNRRKVTIKNKGQSVVYVGGSGVTAAAGLPLEIGEQLDMDIGPSATIYGLVATGDTACDVRLLEFSE